jgi:ABC-2 type transport system permease protein
MKSSYAFYTLACNEFKRVIRIWKQTLVPPIITTVLFFIVFGSVMGSRLQEIEGFAYMQFLAPGLIMMAVITAAYTNVAASLFTAKYQRCIEECLVAPVSNTSILLGYCFGGILRGLAIALLLTLVSLFFVHIPIFNVWICLGYVFFTSVVLSLAGFLNALLARSFDDVAFVPDFILTPLSYLGGVFYAVELLPSHLKWISQFNPIVYIVKGFRYGFLGVQGAHAFSTFLGLVLASILLFIINHKLLQRRFGLKL